METCNQHALNQYTTVQQPVLTPTDTLSLVIVDDIARRAGIVDMTPVELRLIVANSKLTTRSLKEEFDAIFPYLIRVRTLRKP